MLLQHDKDVELSLSHATKSRPTQQPLSSLQMLAVVDSGYSSSLAAVALPSAVYRTCLRESSTNGSAVELHSSLAGASFKSPPSEWPTVMLLTAEDRDRSSHVTFTLRKKYNDLKHSKSH